MDKIPKVGYAIKTSEADVAVIEEYKRVTKPIELMVELRELAHQDTREKSNA